MDDTRWQWSLFVAVGLPSTAVLRWLGATSAIALTLTLISPPTCAQITPDSTIPILSTVKPDTIRGIPSDRIGGGTPRGGNLFHSFSDFNVSAGRGAYFENPAGIQNIFSRVTGSNSQSSILGTLGVIQEGSSDTLGTANLFFINPNGIVFGRNARLDVQGSFVGTTANAIAFGDKGFFSATNPEAPSQLLTINPSALLFNQVNAVTIENRSVAPNLSGLSNNGLQVPDRRSLLLVGGNVVLDGGGLYTMGGRIEIGGLASAGTVGLGVDGDNLDLTFPGDANRANISLLNAARIDTTGLGGGTIQGERVTLFREKRGLQQIIQVSAAMCEDFGDIFRLPSGT
jgi:filamentous hemagglutinin family protein